MTNVQFNPVKFRELMLYIARAQIDDRTFGRVKLEKLLFYSDMEAYGRFGQAITGADYKKDHYGPTAFQSKDVKEQMFHNEEAIEQGTEAWGLPQFRLIPLREPNVDVFEPQELALVDEIIGTYEGITATDISRKSHGEMGWRIAINIGDLIPYESVFLDARPDQGTIQWAKDLARERGWVET